MREALEARKRRCSLCFTAAIIISTELVMHTPCLLKVPMVFVSHHGALCTGWRGDDA